MPKLENIGHVAIIMDGNGRWAQKRSRPRFWGHIRGSKIVSSIIEEADEIGVKALTLYAFSSENWSRPLEEINVLFNLLDKYLDKERKRIIKNRVRFRIIGDISGLPDKTKKKISSLENETKDFEGLKLYFAFGYGGRNEILRAANEHIKNNPGTAFTEESFQSQLFAPEAGDVDLFIRTGGDQRISNFLLWQLAYAELYFTNTLWPDFSTKEFRRICELVSKRERRFGGLVNGEAQSYQNTSSIAREQKEQLTQQSRGSVNE